MKNENTSMGTFPIWQLAPKGFQTPMRHLNPRGSINSGYPGATRWSCSGAEDGHLGFHRSLFLQPIKEYL